VNPVIDEPRGNTHGTGPTAGSAGISSHIGGSGAGVSAEQRREMITAAAYHRYEVRGGAPGDELGDWLAAEKEVDSSLRTASETESIRAVVLRRLAAVLSECQIQLEELRTKAKTASSAVQSKCEKQLAAASAKYASAHEKWVEIREHADGAWGHLKDGAEEAAQEMRVAVRQLASLFK
jgi:hypothetical protein